MIPVRPHGVVERGVESYMIHLLADCEAVRSSIVLGSHKIIEWYTK